VHALPVNFVALWVPAEGLENALPLSGWLPSDETFSLVPGLWRGSKQERHPRIRSARRGVSFLIEEGLRVHYRDRSAQGVAHRGSDRR